MFVVMYLMGRTLGSVRYGSRLDPSSMAIMANNDLINSKIIFERINRLRNYSVIKGQWFMAWGAEIDYLINYREIIGNYKKMFVFPRLFDNY